MMKDLMVLLYQYLILMNDENVFVDFDYQNLYQYLLNPNQFDYFLNK